MTLLRKMLLDLVNETKLAEMVTDIDDNEKLTDSEKEIIKTNVQIPTVSLTTTYGEYFPKCTLVDVDDDYLQFRTLYTSTNPLIPVMAVMEDVVAIRAIAAVRRVRNIIGDYTTIGSLDMGGFDDDDEEDEFDDELEGFDE